MTTCPNTGMQAGDFFVTVAQDGTIACGPHPPDVHPPNVKLLPVPPGWPLDFYCPFCKAVFGKSLVESKA